MGNRTPIEVVQVTATTTYTGAYRLYWITVSASADAVVTISDDTTELIRIQCANKATEHLVFMPSLTVKTSLVITEVSGTAFITTAKAGA